MAGKECKLYYMAVVRDGQILADYTKDSRSKANFRQFTNTILGRMQNGTYVIPYQEYP